MADKRRHHFVLVHGACHGAWCWYKLATLLRSQCHRVTILDMAASGIHPKQEHEVHSFSDYLEPLMEFMVTLPLDEKVVIVGHSMGGVGLSVAMEMFPEKIAVAVFATALMPSTDLTVLSITQEINKRIESFMDSKVKLDQVPENRPPSSFLFGPKFLESYLYQLSPPEDLSLATLLVRPHPAFDEAETTEEPFTFTEEKYGSVQRVYIIAEQDIVLPQELQRWMIELNPPHAVKVINGSDHMLMLSKPQKLFSCLQAIANEFS